MRIPEKYIGVLLSSTDQKLAQAACASEDDEMEGENLAMEVGVMVEQARFDDLIVWGHEVIPDEKDDPYIRAIDEWIPLAEAACFQPKPHSSQTNCLRFTHTLWRKRSMSVRQNRISLETCHSLGAWRGVGLSFGIHL